MSRINDDHKKKRMVWKECTQQITDWGEHTVHFEALQWGTPAPIDHTRREWLFQAISH